MGAPAYDPRAAFAERLTSLPTLGLGVSTEFDAGRDGLDPIALRARAPVGFLEIGVDLERGVDQDARRWVERGWPVTYHFLDVNLEEAEDLDRAWVEEAADLARALGAAWMCGDAGLWHVGPRERGHGVLMPPVLEPDGARAMADNVRALRERSGFEVLPENPPAHVFLGRMHLLDYFARVTERADCGLLLDVAHLAIYQRAAGHAVLDGMDGFPLEHVVEMHVAGGTPFAWQGLELVDDDHGLGILDDTWTLCEHVLARAENLRALVFECERNSIEDVLPTYERLDSAWKAALAT